MSENTNSDAQNTQPGHIQNGDPLFQLATNPPIIPKDILKYSDFATLPQTGNRERVRRLRVWYPNGDAFCYPVAVFHGALQMPSGEWFTLIYLPANQVELDTQVLSQIQGLDPLAVVTNDETGQVLYEPRQRSVVGRLKPRTQQFLKDNPRWPLLDLEIHTDQDGLKYTR